MMRVLFNSQPLQVLQIVTHSYTLLFVFTQWLIGLLFRLSTTFMLPMWV